MSASVSGDRSQDVVYDELYVYGGSGHGKVVADVAQRAGLSPTVTGFVDDDPERQGTRLLDLPVCGDSAWLAERAKAHRVGVLLGIGVNAVRKTIAERCEAQGIALVTAVHPTAAVAPSASLGAGTVVMAGAAINPDAKVGRGVIINTGAVVEHDVVIGDFAHLSPGVATGGAATVGALAHMGLGSVLLPCQAIGEQTVVGAGAAVIDELPPRVVAVGVPARIIRRLPG